MCREETAGREEAIRPETSTQAVKQRIAAIGAGTRRSRERIAVALDDARNMVDFAASPLDDR